MRLPPLSELVTSLRSGQVSPVQLVDEALNRIVAGNDQLNAFIAVWADSARSDALKAEQELRTGDWRGPLHGVPVALKDNIEVAGHLATYGSRARPGPAVIRDAAITTMLQDAGAIILGKTNLLEYAYGIVHPEFGQTNNPWDPMRTSGGSSGGSAAAVAAGMCFMAIGTDTGGSVRIPAAYCGVAGLKPTYGRLPLHGVFPLSPTLDHVGPIAQQAADLALVWSALTGDETVPPPAVDSLRLGLLSRYFDGGDMQAEVWQATQDVLSAIATSGAELLAVDAALLAECDSHLLALVGAEASFSHDAFFAEQADGYAAATRQQLAAGYHVSAMDYLKARRYQSQLAAELDLLLEDCDALLVPTAPWIAPQEDPAIGSDAGDAEGRRTAPFNLSGHPAVSFAIGKIRNCPIGLQVITHHGEDSRALAIAHTLEQLVLPADYWDA